MVVGKRDIYHQEKEKIKQLELNYNHNADSSEREWMHDHLFKKADTLVLNMFKIYTFFKQDPQLNSNQENVKHVMQVILFLTNCFSLKQHVSLAAMQVILKLWSMNIKGFRNKEKNQDSRKQTSKESITLRQHVLNQIHAEWPTKKDRQQTQENFDEDLDQKHKCKTLYTFIQYELIDDCIGADRPYKSQIDKFMEVELGKKKNVSNENNISKEEQSNIVTDIFQTKLDLLNFLAEQSHCIAHQVMQEKGFFDKVTNIILAYNIAQESVKYQCITFSLIKLLTTLFKKHAYCIPDQDEAHICQKKLKSNNSMQIGPSREKLFKSLLLENNLILVHSVIRTMQGVRDKHTLAYMFEFLACFASEDQVRQDPVLINSCLSNMIDICADKFLETKNQNQEEEAKEKSKELQDLALKEYTKYNQRIQSIYTQTDTGFHEIEAKANNQANPKKSKKVNQFDLSDEEDNQEEKDETKFWERLFIYESLGPRTPSYMTFSLVLTQIECSNFHSQIRENTDIVAQIAGSQNLDYFKQNNWIDPLVLLNKFMQNNVMTYVRTSVTHSLWKFISAQTSTSNFLIEQLLRLDFFSLVVSILQSQLNESQGQNSIFDRFTDTEEQKSQVILKESSFQLMEVYLTNILVALCRKNKLFADQAIKMSCFDIIKKWRKIESDKNFKFQGQVLLEWKVMGYWQIDEELKELTFGFYNQVFQICIENDNKEGILLEIAPYLVQFIDNIRNNYAQAIVVVKKELNQTDFLPSNDIKNQRGSNFFDAYSYMNEKILKQMQWITQQNKMLKNLSIDNLNRAYELSNIINSDYMSTNEGSQTISTAILQAFANLSMLESAKLCIVKNEKVDQYKKLKVNSQTLYSTFLLQKLQQAKYKFDNTLKKQAQYGKEEGKRGNWDEWVKNNDEDDWNVKDSDKSDTKVKNPLSEKRLKNRFLLVEIISNCLSSRKIRSKMAIYQPQEKAKLLRKLSKFMRQCKEFSRMINKAIEKSQHQYYKSSKFEKTEKILIKIQRQIMLLNLIIELSSVKQKLKTQGSLRRADLCEILNFKTDSKYPESINLEFKNKLQSKVVDYLSILDEACKEIKNDMDQKYLLQQQQSKDLQQVLEKQEFSLEQLKEARKSANYLKSSKIYSLSQVILLIKIMSILAFDSKVRKVLFKHDIVAKIHFILQLNISEFVHAVCQLTQNLLISPENLRVWLKFDAGHQALDSAMALDSEGTKIIWDGSLAKEVTTWLDFNHQEDGFLPNYSIEKLNNLQSMSVDQKKYQMQTEYRKICMTPKDQGSIITEFCSQSNSFPYQLPENRGIYSNWGSFFDFGTVLKAPGRGIHIQESDGDHAFEWTISFWTVIPCLYPTEAKKTLIQAANGKGAYIQIDESGSRIGVRTEENDFFIDSGFDLADKKRKKGWHHFTVTCKVDKVQFYLDGNTPEHQVQTKQDTERPIPLNTKEAQKLIEDKLKISHNNSLKAMQNLHEKGFISCPSTESHKYSQKVNLKKIVFELYDCPGEIGQHAEKQIQRELFMGPTFEKNDNKQNDAIHPLKALKETDRAILGENEKKIYNLIARYFFSTLYKDQYQKILLREPIGYIGNSNDLTRPFGAVADLRIYPRCLSKSKIRSLHNASFNMEEYMPDRHINQVIQYDIPRLLVEYPKQQDVRVTISVVKVLLVIATKKEGRVQLIKYKAAEMCKSLLKTQNENLFLAASELLLNLQ